MVFPITGSNLTPGGGRERPAFERRAHNLRREPNGEEIFFILIGRNPLKSPDSEKEMKGNKGNFPFISFRQLALICVDFALRLWTALKVRRRGSRPWSHIS